MSRECTIIHDEGRLNDKLKQPMLPLWLAYPGVGRYSIGWRMGYGEDYKYKLFDWLKTLTAEERRTYQKMFPAPVGWRGWYQNRHRDFYDKDAYLLWRKDGTMKYTVESLRQDYNQGKSMKFLLFWGHTPSPDGGIHKTCLSQWWKSDFEVEADKYCCMEQYMMAEKARLFDDNDVLHEIMTCKDPKKIKALGRKVKHFDEAVWTEKRGNIILNGNLAKFSQNEDLKAFLINTKKKVLVEASPYDKIWGIGMLANDVKAENPLYWKGLNLLGFALMEVRDELKRTHSRLL